MTQVSRNIEDVKPGDAVYCQGYLFRVKASGLGGASKDGQHYFLAAEQIVRDGETPLPDGYRYGMAIGVLAGSSVTIDTEY